MVFGTNPQAPAAKARRATSGGAVPDSKATGCCALAFMARAKPAGRLMPGMVLSNSTRSKGPLSAIMFSAVGNVLA